MSTVFILLDPWPLVTKPVNFNAALNRRSYNFHKQWQHCCKINNYFKPGPRKKNKGYHFFGISFATCTNNQQQQIF